VTFVGSLFALAALAVCLGGLGAIVAFTVARRTRETAVTMALASTPAAARRLVLREAFSAAGVGIIIGLFMGALMAQSLSSFLYGVQPADPATFAVAAVAMCVVVVAAACIPAGRSGTAPPSSTPDASAPGAPTETSGISLDRTFNGHGTWLYVKVESVR
jgi:ABC-type antimicrobial peptide transport system permease subunit